MKKALLTLAAVAMAGSAYAQGTILFANEALTNPSGGFYDALIKMPNGTSNADSTFTVGLFFNNTLVTSDTILGTTGLFLGSGNEVVIPGAAAQSTPTLTVRAWQTSAGSYANSAIRGEATFVTRQLGGPNPNGPAFFPADMGNFGNPATGIGFIMTPEPSTYALGALGLGALAMMRRRKS